MIYIVCLCLQYSMPGWRLILWCSQVVIEVLVDFSHYLAIVHIRKLEIYSICVVVIASRTSKYYP